MSSGGPDGGGYAVRRTTTVGADTQPTPTAVPTTYVPETPRPSQRLASGARSTSTRPASQGEGEAGRVSTSLQSFARGLGLQSAKSTWSYNALLERCAAAYWQNRPPLGHRCGSTQGYRDHLKLQQPTCDRCRSAYATYKAIHRHRRALGVRVVREVRPCGTHAAYTRHKARDEKPCPACDIAEREYQHQSYRQRTSTAA